MRGQLPLVVSIAIPSGTGFALQAVGALLAMAQNERHVRFRGDRLAGSNAWSMTGLAGHYRDCQRLCVRAATIRGGNIHRVFTTVVGIQRSALLINR